ncbi:MAG: hypothetical protein HOV68_26770 [Streptomycetaceae bacterium]|nr:hypothetical protein [Streptomycetaceae bacterium]
MAFMRHKTTGYTLALAHPTGEWGAAFVRGGRVAVVGETALTYEGELGDAYDGQLRGVDDVFHFHSDGAVHLPVVDGSWQTLFLHGTRCQWYHWDRGSVRICDWTEIGNWGSALPDAYRADLDVLLAAPDSPTGHTRTYFFQGARVLTLDWETGVVRECLLTEGPDESGAGGWARLPEDFHADLDHVIALPEAGGVRRSLLVKGPNGLILNWATGVEQRGVLTGLMAGLGALPTEYVTQMRPVSGRYTAADGTSVVELRVDLEGERPLGTVSGDVFTVSGGTTTYANSFRAATVTAYTSPDRMLVVQKGGVEFANPSTRTGLQVVIPRVAADQPVPTAQLTLAGPAWTDPVSWTCAWQSAMYRTVDVETDAIADMPVFAQYDTTHGPTPPGYRNRLLSVPTAYAEAGIEMRTSGTANIAPDTSGADLMWSVAELHAAMLENFSLHREVPQWKLWAFAATRFTQRGVIGIMFDQAGLQRQGMAVFAQELRDFGLVGSAHELHTYVHEFGHAFNLLHAWQKNLAQPPAPLGPGNGFGDLSWMNYPQNYRSPSGDGTEAFWRAFPFRFSDNELRHLRHGFYRHVVPGGSDFIMDSQMQAGSAEAFALPTTDESGLRLEVGGKSGFAYGEPVMVELKLSRTRGDVAVMRDLDPKAEHVAIAITDPYGRSRVFRPMARICHGHGAAREDLMVTLTEAEPATYATAYLGYGANGLYMSEPGLYRVVAVYLAPDGSRVVSAPRPVRVRQPLDRTDQHVGELLTGDQQGTLIAVLGSDAPQLQAGNEALQELTERYDRHPLTAYARLARGANAARHFQRVRHNRVEVRRPDVKESVAQLTAAIEVSRGDEGLDNLTLNAAMRRLARVHAEDGNLHRAEAVLTGMVDTFRTKGVPRQVQRRIQQQADQTRAEIQPTG